jgi:rhodanese-related sulfurtransferase
VGIDDLLARSRAGYERLTPAAARDAVADGAVIVDPRPIEQRRPQGLVPGAVVVPRNVLEWRADPTSGHADDRLAGRRLIVMCAEGYASSLAAATLQEIGVRATDMVGGSRPGATPACPSTPARSS